MFGRHGIMIWLGNSRFTAGAVPSTRLLQGRRVRRGRTGHLRSLLLRWHVDEGEGDLAGAGAGSGSHNFDAPLPGTPKMSGGIGFLEHLWGPSPLLVRRGAEVAQRADRGGAHKGFYPASGGKDA